VKRFLEQFTNSELDHIRTATINSGKCPDKVMDRVILKVVKDVDIILQERADKMISDYLEEHGSVPHFV